MRQLLKNKGQFLLYFVGILSLCYGCKSSQMSKNETKAENLEKLETLYSQDNYRVDIEVAYPFNSFATTQVFNSLMRNTGNNASRIDVRGDGNFIEIKNDSVKGYLSFFGERRQNAGVYGGRGSAIQFEEPLKDLMKKIDEKKGKIDLEFKAKQKGIDNENYVVHLKIYPNKNVSVNITPVYRTFMRYSGILEAKNTEEQ